MGCSQFAWSTERGQGQPELHKETCLQKQNFWSAGLKGFLGGSSSQGQKALSPLTLRVAVTICDVPVCLHHLCPMYSSAWFSQDGEDLHTPHTLSSGSSILAVPDLWVNHMEPAIQTLSSEVSVAVRSLGSLLYSSCHTSLSSPSGMSPLSITTAPQSFCFFTGLRSPTQLCICAGLLSHPQTPYWGILGRCFTHEAHPRP